MAFTGFTGYGVGQGNATFQKAAADSIIRDMANGNISHNLDIRTFDPQSQSYIAEKQGINNYTPVTPINPYAPSSQSKQGSFTLGNNSLGSVQQSQQDMADYQKKLTDYSNQVAQQAAAAKQLALRQAWEGNQQALNSQNSAVTNSFNSAKNNLTALQASRTPEYQAQKDATSQEAAAQLRRVQALNALTGKFNSGYNRNQMSDVGLARQGSLDAIQGSENTFNTDVGNRLSDTDAQRVAALNDIAEKLSLGQQQYNAGTLSLTNQLESDKASGALKAALDAQAWGDTQKQLGVDNSFRQAQLDQAAKIAEIQQAFQEKQLTADQANAAINQALAISGVTGMYNGQPTYAAGQDSISNQYRRDALAADQANQEANRVAKANTPKTPTKGADGGKYNDSATVKLKNQIDEALASGKTVDELLSGLNSDVEDGSAYLENYDADYLKNYVESKRPAPTKTPSSSLNFFKQYR